MGALIKSGRVTNGIAVAIPMPAPAKDLDVSSTTKPHDVEQCSEVRAQTLADSEASRLAQLNELAELREKATAEGYAAGIATAIKDGEEAWSERLAAIEEVLKALHQERRDAESQIVDAAVEIAFAAVIKVLGDALGRRNGIIDVVRATMNQVPESRSVTSIRLSPDDWAHLGEDGRQVLTAAVSPPVEIVQDARVRVGGCILGMDRGSLDGRLEVQLGRMKQHILDARARMEAPDGS